MSRAEHNAAQIASTVPEAQGPFVRLLRQAEELGFRPYVSSALRPCEANPQASHVRGCQSWHVLGRAVDLELYDEASGTTSAREPYAKLGEWWQEQGGIWGGVWVDAYPEGLPWMREAGPGDLVHFQWTGGLHSVPRSICDPDKPCDSQVAAYLEAERAKPGAYGHRVDALLGPAALIVGAAGTAVALGHGKTVWKAAKTSTISVVAGLVAGFAVPWFLASPSSGKFPGDE